MSVSLRPINASDKKRMAPTEKQIIKSSPMMGLDKAGLQEHNVVSNSIFGKADHSLDPDSGQKVYEDKYTRTGYIELVKPVLNPFLAGRKAPVWRTILRMNENEIMSIINGNVIYDKERDELLHLSDVGTKPFDFERYIYGAEYLVYLLDRVDIHEVLNKIVIDTFVLPLLTNQEKAIVKLDYSKAGTIVTLPAEEVLDYISSGDDGWIYGNFVLDLSNSIFTPKRREEIYEDLGDLVDRVSITELEQFPLISLLTSMCSGEGTDILKKQVLDYLFVLPYGFRPTIENRVDALTSQYNKLVNANLELRDIIDQHSPTCYAVLNKYREVVQYIRNIFIGDDNVIKSQNLKDYKSLSDTITGKEGLMRGRMQGARVDYSGRAVITCDPEMPIDTIGVPIKMLAKIAEPGVIKGLRNYTPDNAQNSRFYNRNLMTFSTTSSTADDGISYEDYLRKWFEEKDRYGVPGRQPTLFYLGMQAFKIKPVDGDAIVLSPLIVMPFNADFDGDQMHFNMPVTPGAVKEVKERMSLPKNLRYPKNGEITVVTRHEIIYGLWICSCKKDNPNNIFWNENAILKLSQSMGLPPNHGVSRVVYDAVCKQKMNVYDSVTIAGRTTSAGVVALEYAIFGGHNPQDLSGLNEKIKAKGITKMLTASCGKNTTAFLNSINRIVKLGFSVAKIWPPNISTIVPDFIEEHIKNLVDNFNRRIIEREELLNMGIEIESEFTSYFDTEWDKLKSEVIKYLSDNLSIDNGYVSMWKSGGKGDENNILQIFGLKGRVQKNDITAFNTIISGCYSSQLTGLEHFITGYGSRKGIADKVLATAEPGYLSRKLEHAGSIISVTHNDCGTKNGMEFTIEDIVPFIEEGQISRYGVKPADDATDAEKEMFYNRPETQTQLLAAREYLSKIIVGRYCVNGSGNSEYIDNEKTALLFIDKQWGRIDSKTHTYNPEGTSGVVKMRSPVYCDRPCCKKCYGRDIAAGTELPDMGRPIGFIAAQAIGEPGTQMTMKNFQKGGVVTDANLTSSFELIEDYFELRDFSKKKRNRRGMYSYDVISPVEGYVKVQYLGNGGKRILVTETPDPEDRKNLISGTRKIIVHNNTKLKSYVKVGDSFQSVQGNLNMKEVLEYRGYDKAASYLALMLHSIFSSQDVNFKHFETIVASMSCAYLLTDAENAWGHSDIYYGEGSSFKAGSILTLPELKYGIMGSHVLMTLIGLKTLPKYKADFFESLLLENMDSYIPRAILMNPNDSMTNPITLTSFGLPIKIGSDLKQ